ncbi:MFS transporter [Devosia sediminis]|uniref:MFS transporter n=1 Tax=Devosia sediminis TaxID=2798801 RepID=UPI002E2DFC9E|nr:MFS transporter [Devosia sediminis]
MVLLIVSAALFLISIDVTVLYTALPRLTHDLSASNSDKLWIVNAYPLVMAGLLMSTGTLGDKIGHRRMFLYGLVVFGVASVIAAFSPSSAILIASRALLAVGAAMMMPATLSIIRITFTDSRDRGIAIGVWAAVASGGAAFGPVIGGVLLEFFWWGSVFLINVPVIILVLLLTPRIVPDNPHRTWHFSGAILVMIGLVGLIYAIKEVSKIDGSLVVALISGAIGAAFLFWFVRAQRSMAEPMVDFGLFPNPVFRGGAVAAVVAMLAMISALLVLTQRFQLVGGMSPFEAALALMPLSLAALVIGPVAGLLSNTWGNVKVMWISMLLAAVGLVGVVFTFEGDFLVRFVPLVAVGLGLGGVMTGASGAIMLSAPADKAGMAASIEEVSYEFGSTIGVALIGSMLSLFYARSFVLPDDFTAPTAARDSIDQAIIAAETMEPEAGRQLLEIARAAFDNGFVAAVWVVAAIVFVATAYIAYSTRKAPKLTGSH